MDWSVRFPLFAVLLAVFGLDRKRIRKDERGEGSNMVAMVVGLSIGVVIAIVFIFALFATVLDSIKQVNGTAKYPTGSPIPGLLNLVPLLYVLIGVVVVVSAVLLLLRKT